MHFRRSSLDRFWKRARLARRLLVGLAVLGALTLLGHPVAPPCGGSGLASSGLGWLAPAGARAAAAEPPLGEPRAAATAATILAAALADSFAYEKLAELCDTIGGRPAGSPWPLFLHHSHAPLNLPP